MKSRRLMLKSGWVNNKLKSYWKSILLEILKFWNLTWNLTDFISRWFCLIVDHSWGIYSSTEILKDITEISIELHEQFEIWNLRPPVSLIFFCKLMEIKDHVNLSCGSLCDSPQTAYFPYTIYGAAAII